MASAAAEDSLGEQFFAQARHIEARVMLNLQDKYNVEHLYSQLINVTGLIKTLEQHHLVQSQQVEANLQAAMGVYEKARAIRQQQKQLLDVIDVLNRDRDTLREAAGLPQAPHLRPGRNKDEDAKDPTRAGGPLGELSALTERLQRAASASFGDVPPAAKSTDALAFAGAGSSLPQAPSVATLGAAGATGPLLPATQSVPAVAAVNSTAASTHSARKSNGSAPDPTATALEALAMLSSVAPAAAPEACAPAGTATSAAAALTGGREAPMGPPPRFQGIAPPAALALSPLPSSVALAPPVAHTILTNYSLTAHDGGLAAAGLAGPGAMSMWMQHSLTAAAAVVASQPSLRALGNNDRPLVSSGGIGHARLAPGGAGKRARGEDAAAMLHGKKPYTVGRHSRNGHSSDSSQQEGADSASSRSSKSTILAVSRTSAASTL